MQALMQVTFRQFQRGDGEAFRILNEQWIAKYFVLEDEDRKTLGEPEKHILEPGGRIFFATLGDEIVGCCALIPKGPQSYEVAKMAVDESHRNLGIGKAMLAHVVEEARNMGARKLTLETNSRLMNAIHVYEALGFRHVDPSVAGESPYVRADVFMEQDL